MEVFKDEVALDWAFRVARGRQSPVDLHVNSEHVVQDNRGARLRGDTGWRTNPDEAASVPHKLADQPLEFGVIPFLSTGKSSVSRASVDDDIDIIEDASLR